MGPEQHSACSSDETARSTFAASERLSSRSPMPHPSRFSKGGPVPMS
jgi:hypothetical protein